MTKPAPSPPPTSSRWKWHRIGAAIAGYAAILSLGYWGSGWLTQTLELEPGNRQLIANHGAVWLSLAAYALLLAVPFVPGIEISLGLLSAFGSTVALQVYFATVAAFIVSYWIGRIVPAAVLSSFFRWIGFTSAEALVERLRPLSRKERLALLVEIAPRRFIPSLVRYRYLALIVALNLPGNAILGGGGGIALLAGLSGLFSFPLYLIAASLSALPIPAAALFLGSVF